MLLGTPLELPYSRFLTVEAKVDAQFTCQNSLHDVHIGSHDF